MNTRATPQRPLKAASSPASGRSENLSAVLSQQMSPQERDRRTSQGEEAVVEVSPGGALLEIRTAGGPVAPQLADHQLAQGVVEAGGVECPSRGLLAGR